MEKLDTAATIANMAAWTAMDIAADNGAGGKSIEGNWFSLAEPTEQPHKGLNGKKLAAFTRENPTAPAEALYRFAAGQNIHSMPADAWEEIEAPFRLAYAVFHDVLQVVDRHLKALAAQEAEGERIAAAMNRPAPYAGADIDPEDRIDRRGGTLLARNPNMKLQRSANDGQATDCGRLEAAEDSPQTSPGQADGAGLEGAATSEPKGTAVDADAAEPQPGEGVDAAAATAPAGKPLS